MPNMVITRTIWDCRWSRAGYGLYGVRTHLEPDKLWVCAHGKEFRRVTEDECAKCLHWEALPRRLTWH
jgi:hypothetical protein